MHTHNIAHLDISLRNLLTDFNGRYSYIDFELSRRFSEAGPRILYGSRGTEIPPECDRPGEPHDPFKIDVWALAVLIIRACQVSTVAFLLSSSHIDIVDGVLCPRSHGCRQAYAERRPSPSASA